MSDSQKELGTEQSSTTLPDFELDDLEIDLLLDAIFRRYGYDFREYSRASLKRRIINRVQQEELSCISELIPKILHDSHCFDRFLVELSITVTKMFRNPDVFKFIRERVFPKLATYPRINIWHVGCATGEEVYSMAIMLEEEGLLDKTHIYATDYNNSSLAIAEKSIYPIDDVKLWSKNYQESGGKSSLSEFYRAKYDSVKMKSKLKRNITFAHHNLMRDQAFGEMHLILCRNVLIYFQLALQNKVLNMMSGSLVHRGFLVLGDRETVEFTDISTDFEELESRSRVYRKS